jgi:membrane-associated phospholipid phosphatase
MMTHDNVPWARFVSNVLSPPLVWAVMAFPIALRDAEVKSQGVAWALIYTFLVCLMPLLYIAWMVRRGSITDIHMKVRKERYRPFLVSLVFAAVAWGVLRMMDTPDVVPLFALFSLMQLAVMAIITLVWQISMHTMSISGAVVAAGALFGWIPAVVLMPLVVLVAAARLKLQRHTMAQVIAGVMVGVLIPAVLFSVNLG